MKRFTRKAFSMVSSLVAVAAAATLTVAVAQQSSNDQGVTAGDKAPAFTLKDTQGREHSLESILAAEDTKAVVLEWFNPDCPFVRKHHGSNKTMKELAASYKAKGITWIAINSGAPGLQGAGLERNKRAIEEYKIDYPVLLDESGKVGKAYGAKRTPEMYVIARDGTIVYHGAIDNERSPMKVGDTNYVKKALEAHLAGQSVEVTRTRAYGCTVKYAN